MEPPEPRGIPGEQGLTTEQIARSDKDIKTIASLSGFAKSRGLFFELLGGYAVDALLGGKVRRAHRDIDCEFLLSSSQHRGLVGMDVMSLFGERRFLPRNIDYSFPQKFDDSTAWLTVDADPSNRLLFAEDRDDIPIEERRRIEIYFYKFSPDLSISKKLLIGSDGVQHDVPVISLSRLVSEKVRLLAEPPKNEDDRSEARNDDFNDLRELLKSPDFNKQGYLREAVNYYIRLGKKPKFGLEKAEKNWQAVMKIIGN